MIQFHRTPGILHRLYPSLVWHKETTAKELFLTFDDGPHPDITPWVLSQLEAYEAKATFFCVGENLMKYTPTAQQIFQKGSLIANHTHNHLKGWKTNNQSYLENIQLCEKAIDQVFSQKKLLFRPPYGRIKRSQINQIGAAYQIIMWSHLSWDFDKSLNLSKAINAMKKVKNGSIVVFHDSEKSFQNLKRLLPQMLSYWSANGFRFALL